MRPIKFRAWDENKKEMVKDEQLVFWHGNIYRNESGTLNDPAKPHKPATLKGYSVMRDKVMQFTGLLDKNGKEIYEGDIVKAKFFKLGGKFAGIAQVVFEDGGFVSKWEDEKFTYRVCKSDIETRELEIIGNVFENPDKLDFSYPSFH